MLSDESQFNWVLYLLPRILSTIYKIKMLPIEILFRLNSRREGKCPRSNPIFRTINIWSITSGCLLHGNISLHRPVNFGHFWCYLGWCQRRNRILFETRCFEIIRRKSLGRRSYSNILLFRYVLYVNIDTRSPVLNKSMYFLNSRISCVAE